MKLSEKIFDLEKWIVQSFEDTVTEDILNNARKSGEALCKSFILNYYGEVTGSNIIDGSLQLDGRTPRQYSPLNFHGLIGIVTHEKDEAYISIKSRNTRNKVKNYLEAIRVNANPASHDTNNSSDVSNRDDASYTKLALSNLILWFYKDYLKRDIPKRIGYYIEDIKSNYANPQKETTSYEDVRGFDIVKICFPKQKVNNQFKHNDLPKNISYEFITVEIASNNLVGYLFVKKDISIGATLQHFIDSLTVTLASLIICSPRVINSDTGKEIKRIDSIKDKFSDLVPDELSKKTEYFFIDDFVWKHCLAEYSKSLEIGVENEKYFVDQELFRLKQDGKSVGLESSLDYIKKIINSSEKKDPVNIIVGRAGVGKTTFCEQLVSLVNGCEKKRALLISSTDLRDASADFTVESLTDLYRLFVKFNKIESSEVLEGDNLEINISCGNIVLIIDGLDEIESTLKEKFNFDLFIESAIYLNEAHKNCSVIITSREYYLDRYQDKDSVNIFALFGFSSELVDKYLGKRLPKQKVKEAQKNLLMFKTSEQNLHTPLYLSLICDLVDREEAEENGLYHIQESKYFYAESPLDNLIYNLLQREISKQSLAMTCDEYFELIVEISVVNKGSITKEKLNEYIEIYFSLVEKTSSNDMSKYNQFYVSPLLSYNKKINAFKIKYDFVESWAKVRFFLKNFENHTLNNDFKRLLIELYNGSSLILKELVDMKDISRTDYIDCGRYILKKLTDECARNNIDKSELSLNRKAISGLLYFILSEKNKKSRSEYSKEICELFGSRKLNHLYIFGDFFPLDFTDIQVREGWFEQYSNFNKCFFPPDKTVFYYSTFKDVNPQFSATLNSNLFDQTCDINEELRISFDDGLTSALGRYNKVKSDLYKILKVGYCQGAFSWKSEDCHRKGTTITGHNSLDKYLKILILKEAIDKSRDTSKKNGYGYKVAENFKDSAKNLIANNVMKPEMDMIIRSILKEFYDI